MRTSIPDQTQFMTDSSQSQHAPARLVVVVSGLAAQAQHQVALGLRYAATAAALDVAVELHVVGPAVALLRRGAATEPLPASLRQAAELGVQIFVCPQALAEQDLRPEELITEVNGVRGAASLLDAGLATGARFLSF